jgi:hypothetical protein
MSFVKDQLVRFSHWLAIEHYKENATMQTFLQEEMIHRFDEYMSKYSVTTSIVNAMLEERNKRAESDPAIQKKTKKMTISFAEDGLSVMKTTTKKAKKAKKTAFVAAVKEATSATTTMEDATTTMEDATVEEATLEVATTTSTMEIATPATKKNAKEKGSFDRAELARFIHGKKENLDSLMEGFLATLDGAALPSKKSILRAISEISTKEKTIYIVKQECQQEMGIQLDIIVFPVTRKRKASKMKTKKTEEEEDQFFPTEEAGVLDAHDLCEELNMFADMGNLFPTTKVISPKPISGKQAFCDEMNKQKRMRLEKEIEEAEQKLREKQRRLQAVANGAMIFSDEEEEEEEEEVEYKEIFIGEEMLVYNPVTNDVYDTRGMDLEDLSSSCPPIIGKFNPITNKIVMNSQCPYRPPSSTSVASSACGF